MKVIKQPEYVNKAWEYSKITCKCSTVFIADETDVHYFDGGYQGSDYTVKCPVCKNTHFLTGLIPTFVKDRIRERQKFK